MARNPLTSVLTGLRSSLQEAGAPEEEARVDRYRQLFEKNRTVQLLLIRQLVPFSTQIRRR